MTKQESPRAPPRTRYFTKFFSLLSIQYIFTITIKLNSNYLNHFLRPFKIMLKNEFYEPTQLPHLLSTHQTHNHPLHFSSCTHQRSLLVAVLHMLLGLPSPIFPMTNNIFTVSSKLPELPHLDRTLLLKQLDQLTLFANKLCSLRRSIQQISLLPNRIIQGFAIGLHEVQKEIETSISQKLLIVRQEQGGLLRDQKNLERSKAHPICLLGISRLFENQLTRLALFQEVVSLLPNPGAVNNEDLSRSAVFLLDFYFQQSQQEYLTGKPYLLHAPFQRSLREYLAVCEAWVSFNEPVIQSIASTGFFIDLGQALSLNGQRFFSTTKILRHELVPEFIRPHCRAMVELGKTVQFIQFYLSEEELTIFYNFLNTQQEFAPIKQFLSHHQLKSGFTRTSNRIAKTTISSRCSRRQKDNNPKKLVPKEEEDPYSIDPSSADFIYLRQTVKSTRTSHSCLQMDQRQSSSFRVPSTPQPRNVNAALSLLLSNAFDSLGKKCRLMMKQHKIKDSILQTLKGIKRFVLLTQGDFIQQFLEHSQWLLQKPSDKISPNSLQNIIEEAAKSSSCHSFFLQIRECLSFVFLLSSQSSLKGWRGFSFTLKPKAPVSFIFHGASMSEYESIGNLLFNLRRCEQVLVGFWRKSLLVGSASLQHLRSAVHLFVTSLQTYLFREIEDLWEELAVVFESCKSVLELLEANNELVGKLKKVTTEDKSLSNSLMWLIKIVEQLQSISSRLEEGQMDGINGDIQQIWAWFLSLLDQARHIDRLSDSLNFDFDYATHIHNY